MRLLLFLKAKISSPNETYLKDQNKIISSQISLLKAIVPLALRTRVTEKNAFNMFMREERNVRIIDIYLTELNERKPLASNSGQLTCRSHATR